MTAETIMIEYGFWGYLLFALGQLLIVALVVVGCLILFDDGGRDWPWR